MHVDVWAIAYIVAGLVVLWFVERWCDQNWGVGNREGVLVLYCALALWPLVLVLWLGRVARDSLRREHDR